MVGLPAAWGAGGCGQPCLSRAVHTIWGRQERQSNAATARRHRSTRRVATAALNVFQTSHDLCYQRSSDEAADLAASMLVFENGIAFNVTKPMTWRTMWEKSKASPGG
eukprot:364708-Chlamydomonas_euryale.AAC.20